MFDKREYMRKWKAKNKDKVKASNSKYYEAHKETILKKQSEYGKRYRELNREKIDTRIKEWTKTHNGWISQTLSNMRSRAKKKGMEMNIDKEYLESLIKIKCKYTGLYLKRNEDVMGPDSFSFDRIDNTVGYVKGNVECVSLSHNARKQDRTLREMK